uniref:Uncharacterized protein n=1 Tax=Parascaris equorum TaxID=6256 RepID=A0A914RLP7_PAREQ
MEKVKRKREANLRPTPTNDLHQESCLMNNDTLAKAISSISEIAASFTADVLFSQIWLDPGLSFENMTRYIHLNLALAAL